jgi:hypothetical protein
MIRRLIGPLIAATVMLHAGQGFAQGAFPAPLPGRSGPPPNDSAFPPVNGAAPTPSFGGPPGALSSNGAPPMGGGLPGGGAFAPPGPSQAGPPDQCMSEFVPLRQDAEKRGKMIKVASDRHAPPDEACKLIASYAQAELKMLKFVEGHSAQCGIPPQITDQLKASRKNTENMQQKVCQAAQQAQQRGPAGPTLSEVLGSSAALPEAKVTKKGSSTFDTLNGNVLAR